ncbi:MAG: hypothetical protein KIPDCIKN_03127 [Haliscomenobacter sp.]|jgi:hypothetical protein|nr:hypothetical protein [Haliscomenobacter sp.]
MLPSTKEAGKKPVEEKSGGTFCQTQRQNKAGKNGVPKNEFRQEFKIGGSLAKRIDAQLKFKVIFNPKNGIRL